MNGQMDGRITAREECKIHHSHIVSVVQITKQKPPGLTCQMEKRRPKDRLLHETKKDFSLTELQ